MNFFSEILKKFFMFLLKKSSTKPVVLRKTKGGCIPACILPDMRDSDPGKTQNRQIPLFKVSRGSHV